MNELITMTAEITAAAPITEVFRSFIAYIDRSPKTARTYITNLNQFAAWLKYKLIQRPQRQDIISYREWLCAEHEAIELAGDSWKYRTDNNGNRYTLVCKPNTVKQYLQSVKQLFAWTAAEGLYPNIAANIHAPKVTDSHRKDSLTAGEVVDIERSIDRTTEAGKRLYAMYLLAVNAGLRTIELSRANIRDLEVKGGSCTLYVYGKGHTEADTKKPIAPAVYQAIKEYIDSRTDKYTAASPLFVATGNRSGGKRIAPTTISSMLKHAMQAAGYDSERLTAHSLRHTAGQNVLQITGDNIYQTQLYMRHTSPKTTEIYLDNESTEQDAAIAKKLYDHYHGASSTAADKLQQALQGLSADKLERLAAIAAAL